MLGVDAPLGGRRRLQTLEEAHGVARPPAHPTSTFEMSAAFKLFAIARGLLPPAPRAIEIDQRSSQKSACKDPTSHTRPAPTGLNLRQGQAMILMPSAAESRLSAS